MALSTVDLQANNNNFKHFCKICKKGFLCGRALGGHMRAHGIGDDSGNFDDDDNASTDWEDRPPAPTSSSKYSLRTNPNRLRSCRNCENCGKEFLSWKSFLEHGKCSSSEDLDSLNSSPPGSDYEVDATRTSNGNGGWSKRKRSFRAKVCDFTVSTTCPSTTSEEEDLANCLMMLSNAITADHHPDPDPDPLLLVDQTEESSAYSASKLDHDHHQDSAFAARRSHYHPNPIFNNINIDAPLPTTTTRPSPNSLEFRAKGSTSINIASQNQNQNNNNNKKGLFECKACKKVFNSHQALGGHRASHKKVKGCFAARLDHQPSSTAAASSSLDHDADSIPDEEMLINDDFQLRPLKSSSSTQLVERANSTTLMMSSGHKKKGKVHECSICHRVFSSGQALGGHKRCHWISSNSPASSNFTAGFHHQLQDHHQIDHYQVQETSTSTTPIPIPIPIPILSKSSASTANAVNDQSSLDLNLPAAAGTNLVVDDPFGLKREFRNVLSLKVSTEFFLQSWEGGIKKAIVDDQAAKEDKLQHRQQHDTADLDCEKDQGTSTQCHSSNNNNNNNVDTRKLSNVDNNSHDEQSCHNHNIGDEAESKVKLAKLSELIERNTGGATSSPWLQVGIGPCDGDGG